MRNIIQYIIFISIVFTYSCKNQSKQVSSSNIISVFDIEKEDFNPQSVRVVPLQTTDKSLLGSRLKVIQPNDKTIYIGDFSDRKKVLLKENKDKYGGK